MKISPEVSPGKFETAIHSLYRGKFDITFVKNEEKVDYKVDGEIRTLDFAKVDLEEIGDELDEETTEEILDSFKLMFSSGLTKGSF